MSKVRNFISEYLLNQGDIPVDFDVNSKDVDGFNFFLSVEDKHKISTGNFRVIRRKDYLSLKPPYGFGICTNDKIDLADSKHFLCDFDGHKRWYDLTDDENTFQDDEDLDLHVRYNIPRWVIISYTRYNPKPSYPIDIFNLYLNWEWGYNKTDLIMISIRELEKLFENSEHLEQDVLDYLKKVVIDPTIEYYKKLVAYIFNSDILETIVKTIREISDPSTEIFEGLDLHQLFEKAYQDE